MNSTIEQNEEMITSEDREDTSLKYDKINIEIRRQTILSKLAQGLLQSEIARELGIAKSTVCLDCQYLESTAHERIQEFITKDLPMQVNLARNTLSQLKRKTFDIVSKAEKTNDTKTVLQGISIIKDLTESQINLETNQNVIDDVVSRAKKNREEIQDSGS